MYKCCYDNKGWCNCLNCPCTLESEGYCIEEERDADED